MAKRGLKSTAGLVLGVVVAVPVVAAFAIWLLRDEVAEWLVVNYIIPETGFEAAFDGPFDVDLSDTLGVTANDVLFTATTPDRTVRSAQIGRLHVALDMARLLRGVPLLRRLEVSDAEVVLQAEAQPPTPGSRGFRLPFIEAAELSNIRVVQRGADPGAPPLHQIQLVKLLEKTEGGKVVIDGSVLWDGSQLAIEGELGGPENALDRSTPFPMDLVVRAPEFTLDLEGTVADVLSGRGLDMRVALDAPDVRELGHYAKRNVPDVGPFKLSGTLVGDLDRIGVADLNAVIGGTDSFLAKAEGTIEDIDDMAGADVALSLWIADPDLFRASMPEGKPPPESIEVTARLVTDYKRATIQDIVAEVRLPEGLTLDAAGSVGAPHIRDFDAPDEIDVAVEFRSPTTAAAETWIALGVPEMGPVSGSGLLKGSLADLSLVDLQLRTGYDSGARLLVTGNLEHIDFDDPLGTNPLNIVIQADDTAELSTLFETEIPSLGPALFEFVATSILEDGEVVASRWEDLKIRIGTADTVLISAEGRLDEWIETEVAGNESAIRGLDLDVLVTAADLRSLEPILEVELPAGGTAEGSLSLKGDSDALAVSLGTFTLQFPGALEIDVAGGVGRYDGTTGTYDDVNLVFEAVAPDTAAALAGLGVDLPISGPLEATIVLANEGERLSLTRTGLQFGPRAEPTLAYDGSVANIDDLAQFTANGAFRVNMTNLTRDLTSGEGVDLGLASGAFAVSGREKGFSIDRVNVAFDRVGALAVSGSGEIDLDDADLPLALDVSISADSVAHLAADPDKTALPASPLAADGKLSVGPSRLDYTGSVTLGRSDFTTDLLVDLSEPTEVTARIRGNEVFLEDLGLELDPSLEEGEDAAPVGEQAVASPLLFGAVPIPIRRLGDIDLALSIETGPIEGRDFELTRLSGSYDLLDGRLRARTLAEYDRGRVQVDADVDASQDPPTLALTVIGDDLRVDHVLAQFGWKPVLEGDLHMNVDVASRGETPREIAEGLNGTATLAVDKGRIQIGDLERISSNRFQAKRAHARRSEWTDLNCGVIRLNIEDGVATTDGLVLATPSVVIGGSGQIDLRDETMDLVLAADREFSTAAGFDKPVRVHGPITDPEVTANISGHVGDAALTGGEVAGMVALPFIFVPVRVASFLRPQLRENDTSSACLLNGEVNGDTFKNDDTQDPIN